MFWAAFNLEFVQEGRLSPGSFALVLGQMTQIFTLFFLPCLISKLSLVEYVLPNGLTFSAMCLKIFIVTNICPAMRSYCACLHSNLYTKWPNKSIFIQQRLNFIQYHSNPRESLEKVAKPLDIPLDFCRVKIE